MIDPDREVRLGLLLISPERFSAIGEGTARGSYRERKEREALSMLKDASALGHVTYSGIVWNREDILRSIDVFVRDRVDYVLAVFLSWAEDFAWIRFLRDMPPCPVLFCHRMRDMIHLKDTHDDDEFTEYLCCGGLVGTLEASGSVQRFHRPMLETFTGTWNAILDRARDFGLAARARALLQESTFGLLGCMNEVMWSTYVDIYSLFQHVGPEMRFLSVAELESAVESVSIGDAEQTVTRLSGQYEVLPNVDTEKFIASVRASIAMERLAEERGLDVLVLNDIDTVLFSRIGLRPGFWPTSPSVRTLIVPEGDIGSGVACMILKLLTGQHVNYIEPFHVDLPNECFAAGHAGPNDYTDPRGICRISSDVRFARTQWKYAGAPFAWYVFPSGEKTMLHCSQRGESFHLVMGQVEALPTKPFLATYSHSLFRPVGKNCRDFFDALIRCGVTQHYGITDGDHRQRVRDLSGMLGLPLEEV